MVEIFYDRYRGSYIIFLYSRDKAWLGLEIGSGTDIRIVLSKDRFQSFCSCPIISVYLGDL